MPGVVLSSYALIVLGALAVLVGSLARRRDRPYARYFVAAGGALVLIGILGLGVFVSSFG